MDDKDMNTLYCALNKKLTHEGNNQVKEFKINMLVYQYELFKMIPKESISSMFTRITIITNSLDALGRTYTSIDIKKQELEEMPKKNLAFKTIHHVDSDDDDEEKEKDGNKKESNEKTLRCYKCNKTGHIKVDCPLLQNKKKTHNHKQVMQAASSDDSNYSSSDEE
ncbi:zf-CCHC domain-containing protein [Populus alba x Populus x berolinensis]|nr:zf-CCHC domain-containing protein [Populus alba x Populus x berolinensis]